MAPVGVGSRGSLLAVSPGEAPVVIQAEQARRVASKRTLGLLILHMSYVRSINFLRSSRFCKQTCRP